MLTQNDTSRNGTHAKPTRNANLRHAQAIGRQRARAVLSAAEPAAAPQAEVPGWRNAEPRFVHSLKWFDTDGIEHLHVVRSDDLDDVLREIGMVKAFIKAAKVRDECPRDDITPPAEPEPEPAESASCPTHGTSKLRPSKFGGVYCAARWDDGSFCKFTRRRK